MDYQRECLRTLPEGMSKMDTLAMCALGLCGETSEMYREMRIGDIFNEPTKLMLEVGDVMYYAAVALHVLGKEPQCFQDTPHPFLLGLYDARNVGEEAVRVMGDACDFADKVKKLRYHGHELDEGVEQGLVRQLDYISASLKVIANKFGYTVEQVQQMNIDKLRRRYPDGFSTERSVNREGEDV